MLPSAQKDAILLAVAALVLALSSCGLCWKCDVNETVCEVWLELKHALTMMKGKTLIVLKDGRLYPYDDPMNDTSTAVPMEDVITGDGWGESVSVISINDTMPGPTIEVHENQTVRVHLTNRLLSQTTSVHFHGQRQRGTPHMDGVAFVSQCPILPGQTFVHEFQANPVGTYWYHSHVATQTGMGLFGAFVVHPKEGQNPRYHREFSLLLQDYNHEWDTTTGYMKMAYGMYANGTKLPAGRGISGVRYSAFRIQSVLINGRGRHRPHENATHNGAPLSTFTVKKGGKYRFRLIHAGSVYPFEVSVDGHRMTVLSTDGMELKDPLPADAVILTPGERYDFEIDANHSSPDNFLIRATTLEESDKHVGEAILHYEGCEENAEPTRQRRECSSHDPWVVVSCPFQFFAERDKYRCVNVDRLRSKEKMPDHIGRKAKKVTEYFLNFAFPGTTFTPAAVNGIQMELPPVAALSQPLEFSTACLGDRYRCQEDQLCKCTAVLDLQPGEVAQMVFSNLGIGQGWDHPIHMHGHDFWVLKVGYPTYDNDTGNFLSPTQDIDCGGNADRALSFCNNASWSNASWSGNTVPGLELDYPVMKDTVNVPTGGYVVVRIQADNPGVWPLHCHVSLHLEDGMFLLMNESYKHHPRPPERFPTCRNFVL